MNATPEIAALLLSLVAAPLSADTAPRPVVIDGESKPNLEETRSLSLCDDLKVRLRFREERFDPDRVPRLYDALRVTLQIGRAHV